MTSNPRRQCQPALGKDAAARAPTGCDRCRTDRRRSTDRIRIERQQLPIVAIDDSRAATSGPAINSRTVNYKLHRAFFSRASKINPVIDPQVFVFAPGARVRVQYVSQRRRLIPLLILDIATIAGLVDGGLQARSLGVLAASGDCAAGSAAISWGIIAAVINEAARRVAAGSPPSTVCQSSL